MNLSTKQATGFAISLILVGAGINHLFETWTNADSASEILGLKKQISDAQQQLSFVRPSVGDGVEMPQGNVLLGNNVKEVVGSIAPLNLTSERQVVQLGSFAVEEQNGRFLFKDQTGRPTFMFDPGQRSIVAPNGLYIPKEGRLVMADTLPPDSRSQTGDKAVKVSFKNETPRRLDFAWVNYDGRLTHYRTLQPGESFRQSTYESHPWAAVDSAGKIVGLVHPTTADEGTEFVVEP